MTAARPRRGAVPLTAYVLHRYDWSESSLILDLFTREQGRVVAVAKGAKRPYSQLRPVLLPFQRIAVALGRVSGAESPGEVQNLRHAEWAGGAVMPDGGALFAGFYLNELLIKSLARHDPHPLLFDAYAQTLASLGAREEARTECALRAFELVLLRESGVLPDLTRLTLTQQATVDTRRYLLQPEAGVVDAPADVPAIAGAVLRRLHQGLDARGVGEVQAAAAEALPALKSMLRSLLHYHLGHPVLRTRQLMLEVQGLQTPIQSTSP